MNQEIEKIAQTVDKKEYSTLDDATALSAVNLIKQELNNLGCKLVNYKIGFDANGFDIKNIRIYCRDSQELLDALGNIEQAPGTLNIKSQFDKKPNSYAMSAILGALNKRVGEELGLTVRGAAYENDYAVLTFFPAIVEPEPEMPELPEMPDFDMGGEEEELPGEEIPGLEEEGEGAEEELEEIPTEEEEETGEEEEVLGM